MTGIAIGGGVVSRTPDHSPYDSATTVQLTATPSIGYTFSGWSGDVPTGRETTNPLSVVMDANKTITATFVQSIFTITSTAGSNGTISPRDSVSVNSGSSQSFSITPNTGYHVDSVVVDGVRTDSIGSYTFSNVTSTHTIRAVFAINVYIVSATAGEHGSITPQGAVSVEHGANQTFNLTPDTCYHIDSVIVNGTYRGTMSSYTFTNLRGAKVTVKKVLSPSADAGTFDLKVDSTVVKAAATNGCSGSTLVLPGAHQEG